MLLELNIENFAIIDKLMIPFSKGFNVLTGETGAGKSIMIDAVSTVLGGRATKDYIKYGAKKAVIEALFYLENSQEVSQILEQYGIDIEDDMTLLISREIFESGRSVSRINGRTVTVSMLKELTGQLVDIHGQHEHQSLLSWENHMTFIDAFGNKDLIKLKKLVAKHYDELTKLKERLKELTFNEMEKERTIDLLKFQLEEIDRADIKINEEEELTKELSLLSHTEEVLTTIENVYQALSSGDYKESSIIDNLTHISSLLRSIMKYDSKLETYYESIESVAYQLQDMSTELRQYREGIDFQPDNLIYLEERVGLINDLKRKYGKDTEEILKYRETIKNELDLILNNEDEINNLSTRIKEMELKIEELARLLSAKRKEIALTIETSITEELTELNMKHVTFKVQFQQMSHYTRHGFDRIEFMISTNPGEPLKTLAKTASGGEMSRIMLAFKTILADVDNISCLIFDEIDTGISGRTAQVVGEKIKRISKSHQILCITHLPQIAALADSHYLISKSTEASNVVTQITNLSHRERVNEISRLIGGASLTETTKKHAEEMIQMVENL